MAKKQRFPWRLCVSHGVVDAFEEKMKYSIHSLRYVMMFCNPSLSVSDDEVCLSFCESYLDVVFDPSDFKDLRFTYHRTVDGIIILYFTIRDWITYTYLISKFSRYEKS